MIGPLTMAVIAVLPATLLFATEVWSEFLYLLLIGIAILCSERADRSHGYWIAVAVPDDHRYARGCGILRVTDDSQKRFKCNP